MEPHDFWQRVEPTTTPPFRPKNAHPAHFDDGRVVLLPIRPLGDGKHALASLILNQASFAVVDAIAADLATKIAPHAPDILVGLPTLGLTLASELARKLGHSRYAPLGTSRKFWYREDLSTPLTSITTPDAPKRLYVDPRLLPLIIGRRIALIDDVVSSGASMEAALRLMRLIGVEPVVLGAAMSQSDRWRERLGADWAMRTVAVFATPLLSRTPDGGWTAM